MKHREGREEYIQGGEGGQGGRRRGGIAEAQVETQGEEGGVHTGRGGRTEEEEEEEEGRDS